MMLPFIVAFFALIALSMSVAAAEPSVHPSINLPRVGAVRPDLLMADDSAADNKIDQVVSAPGGTTNYYILTLQGQDSSGNPDMEIQVTYDENASRVVLLKSHPSNEPTENLTGFSNMFLSPDNKLLYFQTDAWATSAAIHSLDIATRKVTYIAPGEIACVVLAGEFQNDLIIQQHRYFVQGGSYDNLWLFDPVGKELGLVSEETDASKVCPTLSN